MRYKSEETMDRIVKSIERFFFAHHRSPSITEIARAEGLSKASVSRSIAAAIHKLRKLC